MSSTQLGFRSSRALLAGFACAFACALSCSNSAPESAADEGGGAGWNSSGGTFSPGGGGGTPRGDVGDGDGGVAGMVSTGGAPTGSSSGASGETAASYELIVDAPESGSTIRGPVVVRGSAPGFANVEAWDATHQSPPLGRVQPAADGAFSFTVDSSLLPSGKTTWTIWAWDTAPGVPATRSAKVPLNLTVAVAQPGTGGAGGTGGHAGTGGTGGHAGTGGTGGHAGTGGGGGSGGSAPKETVGGGTLRAPAVGPAPTEVKKVGGAAFTLVKNWNFGTSGTLRNISDLSAEFMYHDQFGTIANGTNYGALTVAPNSATAVSGQPVEEAARPYREFTTSSMKAYVRPLSSKQSTVSVSSHDAGNGSITAKWMLESGGKLLGKDLLWETRVRMPVPVAGYWFALWTAGNKWHGGAEMDVMESFGAPNVYPPPTAFHVDSLGGVDTVDYTSWPAGLDASGVPSTDRDLRDWHIWTWLYRKDDTFVVYYDGYVVQSGSLIWTLSGTPSGEHINMSFLFDLGWGHTQIPEVNITLPAANFTSTYELDYSRVYLR